MKIEVCTILHQGSYKFKVELTQLTAAGSVELWVSTNSDPLNSNKVLDLLHDQQVLKTYSYVPGQANLSINYPSLPESF